MKKNTHPDYHEISVEMNDGSKFSTKSTYGKEGDTLKPDVDSSNHPVWTGARKMLDNSGTLARFNKKFGSLKLSQK